MEDVLTETPPPSRFHQDDLDNFAPPSPPLPAPFLVFSNPKPSEPLRPSILVVAVSSPSIHALRGLPSKALIGTLVLPETPFSGNSLGPSPRNKSCDIYALECGDASVLAVSVQVPVAAERSHAVAGALIGGQIVPERVVVFDSVRLRNFRAGLPLDDAVAFRLETSAERKRASGGGGGGGGLRGVEYFPSGSVAEGLGAALLARCEVRRARGTLCVTWPEAGGPSVSLVKSLLESVLPGLDLSSRADAEDEFSGFTRVKDRQFDSELYT